MFEKPRRKVDTVFIHCSAASRKDIDVDDIRRWHLERGFSDVGYHYFIKTDGTLQEGRNLETTPAAQKGYNTGSIAICLNGLHLHDFTDEQFMTLRKLCREIAKAYSHQGPVRFRAHNEVAAKACPVFDITEVLGLTEDGHLKSNGAQYQASIKAVFVQDDTGEYLVYRGRRYYLK